MYVKRTGETRDGKNGKSRDYRLHGRITRLAVRSRINYCPIKKQPVDFRLTRACTSVRQRQRTCELIKSRSSPKRIARKAAPCVYTRARARGATETRCTRKWCTRGQLRGAPGIDSRKLDGAEHSVNISADGADENVLDLPRRRAARRLQR